MKKTILLLTLISFVLLNSFSQESALLSNKKGVPILPAAGDFGFGISANPLFSYAGNMFSNSGYNHLNLSLPDNALYAKYFLSAKSAVRFKFGINRNSNSRGNQVSNDDVLDAYVYDQRDYVQSDLSLSLGYEKRKGAGRLQLFYGAELNIASSSEKYNYSYGNAHTSDNTTPTTTLDFYNGLSYPTDQRILEEIETSGFGLGLRAFAGLEYFVLPKISVGGEFGLGYTKYFGGKNISTYEAWNYADDQVETTSYEISINQSLTLSDISNGNLLILFYF